MSRDTKENYPSVTQVIGFVNQGAFSEIPPLTLIRAQERGDLFHALAAAYAQGLWIPEVPENVQGYFVSFQNWFDRYVTRVFCTERRLFHDKLKYHGTPDIICLVNGVPTLIDWKTPNNSQKSWRLQIAAYKSLASHNPDVAPIEVERVGTLQPMADGREARFLEYTQTLTGDMAVFMSALSVWYFFNS